MEIFLYYETFLDDINCVVMEKQGLENRDMSLSWPFSGNFRQSRFRRTERNQIFSKAINSP